MLIFSPRQRYLYDNNKRICWMFMHILRLEYMWIGTISKVKVVQVQRWMCLFRNRNMLGSRELGLYRHVQLVQAHEPMHRWASLSRDAGMSCCCCCCCCGVALATPTKRTRCQPLLLWRSGVAHAPWSNQIPGLFKCFGQMLLFALSSIFCRSLPCQQKSKKKPNFSVALKLQSSEDLIKIPEAPTYLKLFSILNHGNKTWLFTMFCASCSPKCSKSSIFCRNHHIETL